jgi:hypothetical protein
MRRRPDKLEPEQQLRLRAYLAEHVMVGALYDQLQRVMMLQRNKHQTHASAAGTRATS